MFGGKGEVMGPRRRDASRAAGGAGGMRAGTGTGAAPLGPLVALAGFTLFAGACADPHPAWLAAPRPATPARAPQPQGAPSVGRQPHGPRPGETPEAAAAAPPSARASLGRGGVVKGPRWISVPGRGLAITATEVTVAQFRSCVQVGRCAPAHFDAGCNYGDPARGQHPMNCASELAAEDFCAAVGGRICTQDEWLAACRGADGRRFPYGDTFDLAACNSQSSTTRVDGRALSTAPVGSFRGCEGGLPGLFDMGGNVAEWVGPCKGTYCKLRGGSYLSTDPVDRFAACVGVCAGNQQTFRSVLTGIRCCRDEAAR